MWKCIVEFPMSKRDFCYQHSWKARQAIASHTLLEFLTIRKCLHKAVFTQEKLDWQEFLSRVTTWSLVSNVTTPTRVDEYSSPPRGWFRTKMTCCSLFTQYHIYEILHCSKIAIWLNLCWHNIFFWWYVQNKYRAPRGTCIEFKKVQKLPAGTM